MARQFSEQEQGILRIVQKNLPDSLTPYADIAKEVGCTEEDVLQLLRGMKEEGSIRRFGASLKHQKVGYDYNAMVAWKVDEAHVDEIGKKVAEHPLISHVYYRPSNAEDWPYTLYTMMHGRFDGEHLDVIKELQKNTNLQEYLVLKSIKELKKISMTYF